MTSNPSTIWAQISLPASPVGSMPFVATDSITITTDVANLFWNQTAKALYLANASDQTGTDTLNLYKQGDSYLSVAAQVLNAGSAAQAAITAGWTVSSSQGTGAVPLSSLTGDFLGKFSGWGYNTNAFVEMAGIFMFAAGATPGAVGGELHFWTKINNGVLTDRITLDNVGAFKPTTNSAARLGAANLGFGALNLDFTITGTIGAVVMNKPAGRVNIAAAAASVVVTNSLVTANSIVIAVLAFIDATLTNIKAVVTGAGSFTITGNANATANTAVNFLVINTDS